MVSLTFYGGIGEIGGNKILLKDGDTKILLDFGASLSAKKQYYSAPFLSPRSEQSLLELGLLPKIHGIYKFDEDNEQGVDAVFLSHSHADHAAYISFLKRSIPVYCGETTATILKAINETQMNRFEYDIEGIQFRTFRTGDKIHLNSIEVEPIHVDHSCPGAYGMIIHTSEGAVAYTGDFRLHGNKPEMSEEFINKVGEEKPLAVITEGTNMIGAVPSSEPEVRRNIEAVTAQSPGLVLADFPRADVDRLNSFNQVAKKNDRALAITLKQAYLLNKLADDPHLSIPHLKDDNILIFQKTKKRYSNWEKEALKLGNVVDSAKVAEMQHKIILVCSFYDFEELIEIKPVSESCYILSASEPFDEEMEIDFERLVNWLVYCGLPQYHIHVSGHVMPLQLKKALETMETKKIFPVHCKYPDLFKRFMSNVCGEIILAEKNKECII